MDVFDAVERGFEPKISLFSALSVGFAVRLFIRKKKNKRKLWGCIVLKIFNTNLAAPLSPKEIIHTIAAILMLTKESHQQ